MAEVFILLGGNVGDKHKIFEETRGLVAERIGKLKNVSSIYVTESWGFKSEPFWNQVLIVETSLLPTETLDQGQTIEKLMGRIRLSDHYESRTMDIDLLFYDDLCLNTQLLTLPHPGIGDRKFVLVPLNEIAPQKLHPVTGISVNAMLLNCQDNLKVERIL